MPRRWFKADYEEEGVQLWDLPFENVEHVDPKIQAVIVSEVPTHRLIYNPTRGIYQMLDKCPEECPGGCVSIVHQFGVRRVLRGWRVLTDFVEPDGTPIEVTLDHVREWKHWSDARREGNENAAKMARTGDEILADIDKVADRDLDRTVAKFQDRFDTDSRSSKVILAGQPAGGGSGGLIVPRHIAEERRQKRAPRLRAALRKQKEALGKQKE